MQTVAHTVAPVRLAQWAIWLVGWLDLWVHVLLVMNITLTHINTIKDELPATFVSLRIIVYPAIIDADLPFRSKI
jgi:hypothetical protein